METKNNRYATLTEATEKLKERGFTHNFEVDKEGHLKDEDGNVFFVAQVQLEEFHRFEGMTDPGDTSIVYALKTDSGGKGIVIDAYGADASKRTTDFLNKIEQHQYQ